MSTASANATGLPDRRHFLSTIAAASALSASALPVIAGAPGPIEAMYPEYSRLIRAHIVACDATCEPSWRYVEPDRPIWTPWTSEGGYKLAAMPNNTCRPCLDDGEKNVAKLKAIIVQPFVFDPTFAVTEASHQNNINRAKKSLGEIEAWQAEVRARKDAVGLTAAEAAEDAASDALEEQRAAILDCEASTVRELAFQAAVLSDAWRQEDAEYVIERLTALAGVVPYGRG